MPLSRWHPSPRIFLALLWGSEFPVRPVGRGRLAQFQYAIGMGKSTHRQRLLRLVREFEGKLAALKREIESLPANTIPTARKGGAGRPQPPRVYPAWKAAYELWAEWKPKLPEKAQGFEDVHRALRQMQKQHPGVDRYAALPDRWQTFKQYVQNYQRATRRPP
jgi:hypothetical protein